MGAEVATPFASCDALERRSPRAWSRLRALVATLVVAGATVSSGAQAADPGERHPLIGHEAPDFTARAMGGGNMRLSEHRGEVVLVGFWTSWCGTCRDYLERLERLRGTYSSAGLIVLGVSLDDDQRKAQGLAQAVGTKFPSLFDGRKDLGPAWRVGDVPMTVLVDRAGVVRYVHGALAGRDEADLVGEIRRLLDE
jgi:peroxiredoxin